MLEEVQVLKDAGCKMQACSKVLSILPCKKKTEILMLKDAVT